MPPKNSGCRAHCTTSILLCLLLVVVQIEEAYARSSGGRGGSGGKKGSSTSGKKKFFGGYYGSSSSSVNSSRVPSYVITIIVAVILVAVAGLLLFLVSPCRWKKAQRAISDVLRFKEDITQTRNSVQSHELRNFYPKPTDGVYRGEFTDDGVIHEQKLHLTFTPTASDEQAGFRIGGVVRRGNEICNVTEGSLSNSSEAYWVMLGGVKGEAYGLMPLAWLAPTKGVTTTEVKQLMILTSGSFNFGNGTFSGTWSSSAGEKGTYNLSLESASAGAESPEHDIEVGSAIPTVNAIPVDDYGKVIDMR